LEKYNITKTYLNYRFLSSITSQSILESKINIKTIDRFLYNSMFTYNHQYIYCFNKLILNYLCLKNIKYLTPDDKLTIKITEEDLYFHKNLSTYEELFLSSFAIAYVLQFPRFESIGLNDIAIKNFYSKNSEIKSMVNMLMINPSYLRFSLRNNLTHQHIRILLGIGMSPMYIYRLSKEYSKNNILTPNFSNYAAKCIQQYIVSTSKLFGKKA